MCITHYTATYFNVYINVYHTLHSHIHTLPLQDVFETALNFIYFSFVTITTTGYGSIVPTIWFTRLLVTLTTNLTLTLTTNPNTKP